MKRALPPLPLAILAVVLLHQALSRNRLATGEGPRADTAPAAAQAVPSTPPAIPAAAPETPVLGVKAPASQDVLWQSPCPLPPLEAFRRWADDYVADPSAEKAGGGVALAATRREALRELIACDPAQALASAVPEAVRRALPAAVRSLLEERVDGTGDLLVTARYYPEGRVPQGDRAVWNEVLLDDGREFEAFVFGNRAYQPSRENLPVHGIALDGRLALSEWPGRLLEPVEVAEARATLATEPDCPVSEQPVASSGTETALLVGKDIEFYCRPSHAQQVLGQAAAAEVARPPGLGQQIVGQNAASSGAGQPVTGFASQGNAAWTTGTKRLMVARVEFSDGQDYTGLSVSDCADIVDGISDAFLSWSCGRYYVRGVGTGGSTISPVIKLKRKAADYTGDEVNTIWKEVQDRLKASGLGSGYDILLVLAGNAPLTDPDDSSETVSWGGLGRVGAGLSFIRVNSADWTTAERVAGNVGVSLHEIGHNLGLYHASNIWNAGVFDIFGPETGAEYGDRYDNMGSSSRDYNARYKEWLNWLTPDNVPLASTGGTYTLREHDLEESSGARGLQVMAGDFAILDTYHLFVEYRLRGTTPASDVPYVPYNDTLRAYGAQIRLGNPFSPKTWLLDATPETTNTEPVDPVTEKADLTGNIDAPLLPGRTFAFSKDGKATYITNLSADPTIGLLQVEVQYGPVPGNDPPAGSITVSTPQGAVEQTILLTASATDPEDADLAYHWQIPGFNPGPTRPAVFPNGRTIAVAFPNTGVWQVRCIVSDKHGGTVTLSRSFSVVTNSPPTISAITNKTMDEDTTLGNLPFTVGDATTPAGSLNVSVSSSNIYLFPFNTITLGGSGANRTLTLAPPANRHGTAVVTVTVSDGELTAVRQFQVTVRPITPGTVILAAGNSAWRYWAQSAAPTGAWQAAAYDDSQWWSGSARFVYPAPALPVPGWSVLPAPVTRLTTYFRRTFTMPSLLNGKPMIRMLCDDGAVIHLNGVEIHRHNLPAAPTDHGTAALASVEGDLENEWITIPVSSAAFVLGGANTLAVEVHDAGGNLRGAGDVTFDLEVSTRQAPTVSFIGRKSSPEDQVAGPYSFTASDAESPGGQLTVRGFSSNPSLVLDDKIKFTHNVLTGERTVSCTPQPNATGATTITLKVSDGVAETWQSFALTVTPVNDLPAILPLPDLTVPFGEAVPLVELRLSDPDLDPAALTVTASATGVLGFTSLEVLPGPAADVRWLRLTPKAGMAAQATITVNVSDGLEAVSDSFILRVTLPFSTTMSDVSLVKAGSDWRMRFDPLPLTPGGVPVDFTAPDFNDANWSSGATSIGYNNAIDYYPLPQSPYRITTYFRRAFWCGPPGSLSGLQLRLRRDDGAAVYLNGTRIWVSNLPDTITPTTLALADVDGAAEAEWHTLTLGTEALVQGKNIIAVEVHQSAMPTSGNPGDFSFDFEMTAVPAPASAVDTLVPAGDTWAYWDGDLSGIGYDITYPWAQSNFADSHWQRGQARLGYGLGGESTVINRWTSDGSSTNSAALFRKTFDIADPAVYGALHVYLLRDDGAAVFLNGVRVINDNVGGQTPPGYLANKAVTGAASLQWHHYVLDPKLLIPGKNLLAVAVHQHISTMSALAFDLQLSAELGGMPTLFIRRNGPQVELSWPGAYTGWQLQGSANLVEWEPVEWAPMLEQGWFYVIQPLEARRFFRLQKP